MSVDFLLTSLVVAAIPGTGVVYTVSSAIGGGRRRGLVAAIGCTLGIVPHILAAMLGLSGIMQAGALAFEVVRWAGVAYLLYMGISMIRDGGSLTLEDEEVRLRQSAYPALSSAVPQEKIRTKEAVSTFTREQTGSQDPQRLISQNVRSRL